MKTMIVAFILVLTAIASTSEAVAYCGWNCVPGEAGTCYVMCPTIARTYKARAYKACLSKCAQHQTAKQKEACLEKACPIKK